MPCPQYVRFTEQLYDLAVFSIVAPKSRNSLRHATFKFILAAKRWSTHVPGFAMTIAASNDARAALMSRLKERQPDHTYEKPGLTPSQRRSFQQGMSHSSRNGIHQNRERCLN